MLSAHSYLNDMDGSRVLKNIHVVEWASEDGLEVVIVIYGSFDVRRRFEFSEAFRLIPEKADRIIVDLEKTTYIDYAAVGMLLGLRTYSTINEIELILRNCNNVVRPLIQRDSIDSIFKFD